MPSGVYIRTDVVKQSIGEVTKKRWANAEYKQKMKNVMKGRTGVYVRTDAIKKITSEGVKRFYANGGIAGSSGKHRNIIAKQRISNTLRLYYLSHDSPLKNCRLSKEQKQKHSEWMKKYYLTHSSPFKNCHHSVETKKKISETKIANPNHVFSGTKIELKLRAELEKRGFEKDVDFFCNFGVANIANVDIYLPAIRTIIECDGDYWHNRPGAQENDARKTASLRFLGFNVYRFWEHDINKSPEKCIEYILLETNIKKLT